MTKLDEATLIACGWIPVGDGYELPPRIEKVVLLLSHMDRRVVDTGYLLRINAEDHWMYFGKINAFATVEAWAPLPRIPWE